MQPLVSIIMGSTSDLPVMEKACKWLEEQEIPFEVNALSAHRTPEAVEKFAREAKGRGLRVIIAGAGMAAALPGVIAASTTLPVIGVPIKGMLDGLDAMLSIIQMPPGIPVATVGVNGAQNAAVLAAEMMALADEEIARRKREANEALQHAVDERRAQAEQQAGEIVRKAREDAAREHERVMEQAKGEISELMSAAAEKLVLSSTSDAYDKFLDTAEERKDNG